jgi:RHS repeat-associated protein
MVGQTMTTGASYYRARYYDPKIGRFLREDPNDQGTLGEATNLYRYVENSSTNYTDPHLILSLHMFPGLLPNRRARTRQAW